MRCYPTPVSEPALTTTAPLFVYAACAESKMAELRAATAEVANVALQEQQHH